LDFFGVGGDLAREFDLALLVPRRDCRFQRFSQLKLPSEPLVERMFAKQLAKRLKGHRLRHAIAFSISEFPFSAST
jgi:hypothetical protein